MRNSFDHIYRYWKSKDFKSYDPCDIDSLPFFVSLHNWSSDTVFQKYVRFAGKQFQKRFQRGLRKLGGVRQSNFAQSDSFIVRALLNILALNPEMKEEYLRDIKYLISRVEKEATPTENGKGWGQPYDWFSLKYIPAYTIRTTVSAQILKMYLRAYEVLAEKQYLDRAEEIVEMFVRDMPRSVDKSDECCFGYTFIDDYKVHNSVMMAAGSLALFLKHRDHTEAHSLCVKILNFVFRDQQEDGSWKYYYGNRTKNKIDTYHTGYILENLIHCQSSLQESFSHKESLHRGVKYFRSTLLHNDYIPKYEHNKEFPTDIQACAQSLVVFALLSEWDLYFKLMHFIFDHFYNEEGWFYYRINAEGNVDKNSYIRWADSWILYALSLNLNRNSW